MTNNGHITWRTEKRRLGDLLPWEPNPRQIRKESAERLRVSLDKFGYSQLLEVEPDNTIVDGHQREPVMKLMEQFGPEAEIEVRVASRKLTLEERKEYIALRHQGAFGEWNWDHMHNLYDVAELLEWGFEQEDLEFHGFEFEEEEPAEDPGAQVDRAEELREKWQVKPGDMWRLGEHRLICGDCTERSVVERVMQGERAAITFTSPPYNAGVSAKLSGNTHIDNNLYGDEYDDNQKQEDWLDLMNKSTEQALSVSDYVFMNVQFLAGNKKAFVDYLSIFRDFLADIAIWDKGHAAPAAALRVMDSRFEFILVFSHTGTRAIGTREFRGMVHNVYEGSPQRHNEFASTHAATFPADFPGHFIKTFTNDGENVFEPFCGTGTTIVACERTNRRCIAIELSKKYVAVALERWHQMTGLQPELVE